MRKCTVFTYKVIHITRDHVMIVKHSSDSHHPERVAIYYPCCRLLPQLHELITYTPTDNVLM